MRRVVITGMGAFAAPGRDVKAFFDNLVKGHSAVCRITQFDPAPLTVQIGAEIAGYVPKDYFPQKRLDLLDRFSQFALLAAGEAIESSGIVIGEEERPRVGVVMGSGMGGVQTYDRECFNLYVKEATKLHPFTIPKMMHNAPTSQICMEFGAQGPSFATATACSSAGHAIGEAFHLVKFGMADMVLAGGSDAPLSYSMIRCWESVRVLSTGNEPGSPLRRPR